MTTTMTTANFKAEFRQSNNLAACFVIIHIILILYVNKFLAHCFSIDHRLLINLIIMAKNDTCFHSTIIV